MSVNKYDKVNNRLIKIAGNGGGSGSAGIRYDEENDVVQLFYDGEWVDWLSPGMDYPIGTEIDFTYTGVISQFVVPANGTWKIEAYGAQGGATSSGGYAGGKGGYAYGNVILHKDDILYVCVGQNGGNASSGGRTYSAFNGGGSGKSDGYGQWVGGGGGATHVATAMIGTNGLLSEYSDAVDREKILIVAGGGGGAYYDTTSTGRDGKGGTGGGTAGGNAEYSGSGGSYGGGGTQNSGNAFGQGGSGSTYGGGAGGGWYGGYAGVLRAGGGGSGYVNETELIVGTTGMNNGQNEGNGSVKFTYVSRNIS